MKLINQDTFLLESVQGTDNQTLRFYKQGDTGKETYTMQDGTTDEAILEVVKFRAQSNPALLSKIENWLQEINSKLPKKSEAEPAKDKQNDKK